jgi:outer membrane usher protein
LTSRAERLAGLLGRGLALGLGTTALATSGVALAQPLGGPTITGPTAAEAAAEATADAAAAAAERRRARLLEALADLQAPPPSATTNVGRAAAQQIPAPVWAHGTAPIGALTPESALDPVSPAAPVEALPPTVEPQVQEPVPQGMPELAVPSEPVDPAPKVAAEPLPAAAEFPAIAETVAPVDPVPAPSAVTAPLPLAPAPLIGAPEELAIDEEEEVEPEAGITFRRDPLELPLLDSRRWIEWVLSVNLNGSELDQGVLFIEEPRSGRLAVELSVAQDWRLRIDPDALLSFEGVPFLPLDSIEGLESSLDQFALVLTLDIPPDAFEMANIDVEERNVFSPTPGTGAFFDYDVLLTGGQGVSDQLDGLFETGIFAAGNVLLTNFRLENAGDEPELQRLETTLTRDLPDRRASFRLGDSLTQGGSFAQGVRFGGIQYATNFETDPAFVTFPLPSIGGLAEQDSVVDVIVDNLTRATEAVRPGPFTIDNVPVVTGGGEVQLRVTDLLGRERLVTQSYYVSSRLLKEGLHDFSYEVGAKRNRFGEKSFDYGDILATATHRYGFTNGITGEVHAEAEKDRVSAVGGGALLLGPYGLLTGGIGGSFDEDENSGVVGQLAYEYIGRRFNIGLRSRYTSSDFRQAAGDDGRFKRVDQFNIGYDALDFGRFGLLLLNQVRNDDENQRSATASYSLPIGPGSLVVNAARTIEPDRDFAVTAAYAVSLGPQTSVTATGRVSNNSNRARLQYNRTRGASELGLDYRVATEIGEDNRPIDARVGYQTSYFGTDLDVERFSGDNRFRLGVNGSAAVVDGNFGISRRIGRSFGLVDLPGFPNVRVFLDNREAGTTDAAGRLMLPNLRPYEPNRVRLAIEDLPLSADLVTAETAAVPYGRSGMTIDFGIASVERATVTLLDSTGKGLPAGLILLTDTGDLEAMVGRDGFTQLTGALDERRYLAGERAGRRFVCAVPAAPGDDPLPHLGDVRCAD